MNVLNIILLYSNRWYSIVSQAATQRSALQTHRVKHFSNSKMAIYSKTEALTLYNLSIYLNNSVTGFLHFALFQNHEKCIKIIYKHCFIRFKYYTLGFNNVCFIGPWRRFVNQILKSPFLERNFIKKNRFLHQSIVLPTDIQTVCRMDEFGWKSVLRTKKVKKYQISSVRQNNIN